MLAPSVTEELVTIVAEVSPSIQPENIHYQVVHWTTGRFRIRILRLSYDSEYASKLKYLVESLDFVTSIQLNPAASSLVVNYNHEANAVALTIVQEKLFVAIQEAPFVDIPIGWTSESEAQIQKPPSSHEIDLVERLGLPALGLVLSVAAMVGLPVPGIVIAGVVVAGAVPVFRRAWEAIQQERQLTIDFLDGLAIALHTLQGNHFAPSFMLGLVEGGEVIRDMTARGSERASLDLLDCLGKYAIVERDGEDVQILVSEVVVGDRVIVYPGDQIPVDGIILRGTGLLDQCKLTGESIPVTRREGEEVLASTLLVNGHLCILTERTGNNTRAGVIVNLMQSAPVHDTRVENYAATVANQAVLPTLLIGIGVGIVTRDLNRAVALLTLDLGTGIRVSVPTTILSALTYAARNGVFIRSGRAIEILSRIDTVVFDKTGTLTVGHAGITDIKVMNTGFTPTEILALAATGEQGLTHPVAEAIIRHAKDTGVELKTCEEWEYKVGLGIVAKIDGIQLMVGSPRFMTQENIDLEAFERRYPDAKSGSHSLVYVAGNGELLGVIMYSDPPRAESKEVIKDLRSLGIEPYMLSGDVTRVAKAVAGELGMNPNNIYAEAFPEKKVEVVKALHDSGKTVAFCGDGINDSAALAYADVSISFAGATDIARETADVVLMEDNLQGLTHAILVARNAMDIIWQNTAIVALPNLGALLSGIVFALDPLLAVVINNGTAILAELNGLRPLLGPGVPAPAQLAPAKDPIEVIAESNNSHSSLNGKTPKENGAAINAESNGSHPASSTVAVETKMPSPLGYLKQTELAKRLGLPSQTLTHLRSNPDFIDWTRAHDPEGIAWLYEPGSECFYTVEVETVKVEHHSNGLKRADSSYSEQNENVATGAR